MVYPIEWRLRTKQAQLRYNQLVGRHGTFYTDTFFSSVPSINNCKMAQIYTNDVGFTKIYLMSIQSQAGCILQSFLYDVGILHRIRSDDEKEPITIESPVRSITLPRTSGTRFSHREELLLVDNVFLLA
jgi:hypothetical protein